MVHIYIFNLKVRHKCTLHVRGNIYICNSYTMAARDFFDMYTQSMRAAGPRAKGVYITKTCGVSDICNGCKGFC